MAPFERDKVIKVPEKDRRRFYLAEFIATESLSLGKQTIAPGCLDEIRRFAAIPGNTAFPAELG